MRPTGGLEDVTIGGARHPAVSDEAMNLAREMRERVDLSRAGAVRDFLAVSGYVNEATGDLAHGITATLYAGAYAAAAAWLEEFAGRIGHPCHAEALRLRASAVNALQGRAMPGETERRARPRGRIHYAGCPAVNGGACDCPITFARGRRRPVVVVSDGSGTRAFEENAVPWGDMAATMLGGGALSFARELAGEDWRASLHRMITDAERLEVCGEIGAGAADCITLAATYLATAVGSESGRLGPRFYRETTRAALANREAAGRPEPSRDGRADPPAPLGVFQIRNAGSAPDSPPEKIEAPHIMRAAELFMEQTQAPATPALSVVFVLDPFESVFRLEVENRGGFWTANAPTYVGRRGVEGWSWLT